MKTRISTLFVRSILSNKLFNSQWFLGVVGVILIPIDSHPFFPIPSENRPSWAIPFILLTILELCRLRKLRKDVLFLLGSFVVFCTSTFINYSFFEFGTSSVKSILVFLLCFPTILGVCCFLDFLLKEYGLKTLPVIMVKLFLAASVLPLLVGLVQFISYRTYPQIGVFVTHLFSFRVDPQRMQLVSGEPFWASTFVLFVFFLVTLFAEFRRKLLLQIVLILVVFLVSSSLVYIYVLLTFLLLFLFYLKKRTLLYFLFLIPLLIVSVSFIYSLLPGYTQGRIGTIIGLVSNVSVENFKTVASIDWSFMIRFFNPLFAFLEGFSRPLFGHGIGNFKEYVVLLYENAGMVGYPGPTSDWILAAGATPKAFLAKLLFEGGFVVLIPYLGVIVVMAYHFTRRNNKEMLLLLLFSFIIGLNEDSYLHFTNIWVLSTLYTIRRHHMYSMSTN